MNILNSDWLQGSSHMTFKLLTSNQNNWNLKHFFINTVVSILTIESNFLLVDIYWLELMVDRWEMDGWMGETDSLQ